MARDAASPPGWALMLDDIFSTIGASDPNFSQSLAQTNSELGLNLRDDLASALGGELTLALDGPVLPTPSWKAVVEVNNSGALQLAIEKLVQDVNREAQKSNHPGVTLNQTQAGGRTFYTMQFEGVVVLCRKPRAFQLHGVKRSSTGLCLIECYAGMVRLLGFPVNILHQLLYGQLKSS